MAAPFYGVDISSWPGSGLPDLDPTGKLVSGNVLLAQCLLNRLFCDRGSYLQSPNFGFNLLKYMNNTDKEIIPSSIAAQVKMELKKDERVDDIACLVTYVRNTLTVRIQVTPNNTGPFALIMRLDQTILPQNFEVIFQEAA